MNKIIKKCVKLKNSRFRSQDLLKVINTDLISIANYFLAYNYIPASKNNISKLDQTATVNAASTDTTESGNNNTVKQRLRQINPTGAPKRTLH